jgi:hypothetical protein
LFLDFDELRDEGEGGAKTCGGAEDFDGLRGGHLWRSPDFILTGLQRVDRRGDGAYAL